MITNILFYILLHISDIIHFNYLTGTRPNKRALSHELSLDRSKYLSFGRKQPPYYDSKDIKSLLLYISVKRQHIEWDLDDPGEGTSQNTISSSEHSSMDYGNYNIVETLEPSMKTEDSEYKHLFYHYSNSS